MSLDNQKQDARGRKAPRAMSPEARENQLIDAAMSLAEKQIQEGTATSQVITHFLKLGTERESLEKERLRRENKLLDAKVEELKDRKQMKELYVDALNAMKRYSGNGDEPIEDLANFDE